MSLVAYASSDDSDIEEEDELAVDTVNSPPLGGKLEDYEQEAKHAGIKSLLKLPVPKKTLPNADSLQALFGKLPQPQKKCQIIEEEDDEFLRKRETTKEPSTRNAVRIELPSLKDFKDVEEKKRKSSDKPKKLSSFSSLMNILPEPKAERNFVKPDKSEKSIPFNEPHKTISLVPDTVRMQRLARNTENIEKSALKNTPTATLKSKPSIVNVSDSDGSDNEGGDFFSLSSNEELPKVSKDEIAALVSKKAAQMASTSSRFLAMTRNDQQIEENSNPDMSSPDKTNTDDIALEALISRTEKRRKKDTIQIIDIDDNQVRPNKDEWLRTALASATTYQPTGVLTDAEPAAGTRRKHQITYLAHKAKANEAELQAMWSTNRQNRRQTQNKYGF